MLSFRPSSYSNEQTAALNPAGQGSIIDSDLEQWCQNHFLVVFDLRNRDITGITGASPATSLTINLQLERQGRLPNHFRDGNKNFPINSTQAQGIGQNRRALGDRTGVGVVVVGGTPFCGQIPPPLYYSLAFLAERQAW